MTDNPWLSQPAATPYPEPSLATDEGVAAVRAKLTPTVAATSKDCVSRCCRVLYLGDEQVGNVIHGRALLARYTKPDTWTAEELRAIADHLDHTGPIPYREPSGADLGAQEPVEVAGEGHDAQEGAE